MGDDNRQQLRQALARYAHEAWASWMRHLFDKSLFRVDVDAWVLDRESRERWQRQVATDFDALPKDEQESDYRQADRILELIERHGAQQRADDAERWRAMMQRIDALERRVDVTQQAVDESLLPVSDELWLTCWRDGADVLMRAAGGPVRYYYGADCLWQRFGRLTDFDRWVDSTVALYFQAKALGTRLMQAESLPRRFYRCSHTDTMRFESRQADVRIVIRGSLGHFTVVAETPTGTYQKWSHDAGALQATVMDLLGRVLGRQRGERPVEVSVDDLL